MKGPGCTVCLSACLPPPRSACNQDSISTEDSLSGKGGLGASRIASSEFMQEAFPSLHSSEALSISLQGWFSILIKHEGLHDAF